MTFTTAPTPDQVEITLFGPGFGECIVVHLGSDIWVVIDSCIHSDSGEPAAVHYLQNIGVDASVAVHFIVATHWHDDHVRGISRVLAACPNAEFCASSALTSREFLNTVQQFDERIAISGGSGASEILNILNSLERADGTYRSPIRAMADRPVFTVPKTALEHGREASITTLSPSDGQFEKFLFEIAALMPEVGDTRHRLTPQGPNHLSVVTWIQIGEIALLLGGDLEETGDPNTGWSVIAASKNRPQGQAHIFKLPHHGAGNAHCPDVWDEMLVEQVLAILTPFNRGRVKRPAVPDVKRILSLTSKAFITSDMEPRGTPRRSSMVERTIRERVGKLRYSEPPTGCIRIRNGGVKGMENWSVEKFGPSMPLEQLYRR